MNVAEHLEHNLGQITRGWLSDSTRGVQVCLFANEPNVGVNTLSTLGLSDTILSMPNGRKVRQELLIAVQGSKTPDELAKLLLHVADHLQSEKQALLRGDVFPLGSKIDEDSDADSLYASIPAVFPDELATLNDTSPATVFVWLIPLQQAEVEYLETVGWSDFEDRLEAAEPDLFDLRRASIC